MVHLKDFGHVMCWNGWARGALLMGATLTCQVITMQLFVMFKFDHLLLISVVIFFTFHELRFITTRAMSMYPFKPSLLSISPSAQAIVGLTMLAETWSRMRLWLGH